MSDSLFKLSSGRLLGWAEYGDPSGTPLLFFHGWPSSRLQGELLDLPGKEFGLRIIAPDRPGIGTSEFQPGRTVLDWPPVMAELAAHLGLEKFYVMGVSGGGPYALVCAHQIPERLLGVGVVCGAPPLREVGTEGLFWPYKLGMWAQRYLPFTLGPGLRVAGWMAGRRMDQWPQTWLSRFTTAEDRRAMQDARLHRILMESGRVGMFSNAAAVRWDGNLYSSDWGFDLAEIRRPILFWHGGLDWNIPLALAQKAAARIQGARFTVYPEDGHYSLPLLRARQVTLELIEARKDGEMLK